MKVTENAIKSVGLTVLYEPQDPEDAVVDIVLVHGIGGHPVRSWKWIRTQDPPLSPSPAEPPTHTKSLKKLRRKNTTGKGKNGSNTPLRRTNSEPMLGRKQDSSGRGRNVLRRKNSSKSSSRLGLTVGTNEGALPTAERRDAPGVYWPLDILPTSCPNARILSWGHITLVAGGKPLRLQDGVFSHARDLLHDLAGAREAPNASCRPLIFVAHSTGGTLVKEILRLSELESQISLRQVLLSTTATVFLASPHRGSEKARFADAVKSMASLTLGVEPGDTALEELTGSTTQELEVGRIDFIRLWDNYNFQVKTYQESMVMSSNSPKFPNARMDAFIRRQASFIGNPKEGAETIQTSHLDICKFDSSGNGGYRSLVNTLLGYIRTETSRRNKITDRELECFAALSRPQYPVYQPSHAARIYPGTCLWLYDMPEFQSWYHRSSGNGNKVFWLQGPSGSGKSVLLRSLRDRIEEQWSPAGGSIISVSAGRRDAASISCPGWCGRFDCAEPCRVYRDLLSQLFFKDPNLRKALVSLYERYGPGPRALDHMRIVSFFADTYVRHKIETPARRTFILIDVSDGCGQAYLRDLQSSLSALAANSDFNICVVSGRLPETDADEEINMINVTMHPQNGDDILHYVSLNLEAEWEERNRTVVRIGEKAGGVFLWAEIVVNILNAAVGEGASQELIEYTLEEMPESLHGLYEWMLGTLDSREKEEALVLFQWVILAAEPMRLNDLLVAVRLTRVWPACNSTPSMALQPGAPSRMGDLPRIRNSEVASDTPSQLHRWIRSRSIGLLETRSESPDGVVNEPWGLQCVQVTHDSVRSFFLSGRGFACLTPSRLSSSSFLLLSPSPSPSLSPAPTAEEYIDRAHYSMLHACLVYLNMRDFEHLGHAGTMTQASAAATSEGLSESEHRRRNAHDQRNLIVSSYPFLRYAVRNLLFHLLAPLRFRYFLPQSDVLHLFSADRCRLWRRWSALLGTPDPAAILALHDEGPAARVLDPVFGSRFRLERIFRRLARTSAEMEAKGEGGGVAGGGSHSGGRGVFSPGPQVSSSSPAERTLWSPRSARHGGRGLSPIFQPGSQSPMATVGSYDSGVLGIAM